ncbi:cache domain-containing sensor histidine kinase [Paenibacillus hexagrammi]|uniref:Histidine kinase n=1 Tax=Paenibacillus hexagrammi TaxID=2908839 RepID=A0ABY3SDM0_9BACL|nr:sensor histidine kinase [Paenibacillus sp. YPD9-1]UJF32063.1 histidine kinase [Paenibacillus sp. YPD9-1]
MMKLSTRIWPQKLKYRLTLAFLLLILLPFAFLNIYNYQKVETLVQRKISEQSLSRLDQIKRTLEDQMSIAFKTLIFLEQDSSLEEILKSPGEDILTDKSRVEEKFKSINNSFFLYNPSVYFTLLDLHGHVYTSYQPKAALDYNHLIAEKYYKDMLAGQAAYHWVSDDTNDVSPDVSKSAALVSLYALLKDHEVKPYAVARISIDFVQWFQSVLKNSQADQEYSMITGDGLLVAQPESEKKIPEPLIRQITSEQDDGYLIDKETDSVLVYSYMETLDWYIVNRIPLDVLFNEIQDLQRNYFATFILLTSAFIVLTFMISSTVTRPLSHLQVKMRNVVHKSLKTRLPEGKSKGEVLELTRAFNKMLDDMNDLIQRLKVEERQKEAVHFQMLLAQMNPHFLMNTLNTMKWIAIRNGQDEIAEISVSLGKLLETSLNSEIEMIHFRDEIELVKAYIYIQQMRYKQVFEVDYEYEPSIEFALVPKLSLQPIVENAIQHGISTLDRRKGNIRIHAYVLKKKLIVDIIDNGIGMEKAGQIASTRQRRGIGMANVRERLRLLFKEEGTLTVIAADEGTHIRMELPELISAPYEMP